MTQRLTKLIFETINVTSANANRQTILKRKAHVQPFQEHCMSPGQSMTIKRESKTDGKRFDGGLLDPEQGKAAAGVGIMSVDGLKLNPTTKPIKDYRDAFATGRCAMYEVGLKGTTLAIAVIYGWTGGRKGSAEAARTDDILTIVQMQFESMPVGPKLIAGDLN